jgi:hypothetical protein
MCKKDKCILEVHHIAPNTYSNIFAECCNELKLIILEWQKWTELQIKNLEELIIQKHIKVEGITVCKECHSLIDPKRHALMKK